MTRKLPWLKGTNATGAHSSQPCTPITPRPKRQRILDPNPDIDDGSEDELVRRKSPNVQCRCDLSLTECLLVAEIIPKQLPLNRPLFHLQKGMSGASLILHMTS